MAQIQTGELPSGLPGAVVGMPSSRAAGHSDDEAAITGLFTVARLHLAKLQRTVWRVIDTPQGAPECNAS